jgi:hypothetical protein
MCKHCTKAHQKSKLYRDHMLMPMEEQLRRLKTALSDKIKILQENQSICAKTIVDIDSVITKIKYRHQDLCMQADKYADRMIKEINNQREQVKREIETNEDQYLNVLKENRDKAVKYMKENDCKCAEIGKVLNVNNMPALIQAADNIDVKLPPLLPANNCAECELVVGRDFDSREFLDVKIKGKVTVDASRESEHLKSIDQVAKHGISDGKCDGVDFQLMINAKIKVVKRCDAVSNISRIYRVNGDIFMTQFKDKSIAVYSKDLKKLITIKHEQISNPQGLTVTDNSTVIVACWNGLHELHADGKYSRQISAGLYNDVTYYNNQVYALKYEPQCVEVYTLTDGKFVLIQSIDIHHVKYTDWISRNRIFITQSTITVATGAAVYTYDDAGQLLHTIKHKTLVN